jgi:hypothetical protein
MKISTHYARTGLKQAAGIIAYILLVVTIMTQSGINEQNIPGILAPLMFILMFVTSALICGTIALYYPATLALQGKVRDALEVIAWTGVWMIAMLVILVTTAITLST